LLEERLASGTVDEPLQGHRAPARAGQRPRRHGEVGGDEVELGCPDRLEEDLARVRDHDLAIPEPEDLLLLGHGRMLAWPDYGPVDWSIPAAPVRRLVEAATGAANGGSSYAVPRHDLQRGGLRTARSRACRR